MKITKQHKLLVYLLLVSCLLLLPFTVRAQVSIIVNHDVAENSISSSDIKSIFTNKLPKWDDGKKINIIILEDKEPTEHFLKQYIHKSHSQFRTYWLKQVFTGKAIMFKSVSTHDELLEKVSTTPGAIGFIDSAKIDDRVKVVTVSE